MFGGMRNASIGGVRHDDAGDIRPAQALGALPGEHRVGDEEPDVRRAVLLERARPLDEVPPVIVTSSPTMATLPRTRPVTSVTSATSWAGRVLCMRAKSPPIISAKRAASSRGRRRGDRDDALAGQTEIPEMLRERGSRHVVDGDAEEALDLPRVQVHRQDPVGAGELEHVRDELARIGSRGFALRSWREYGNQGATP